VGFFIPWWCEVEFNDLLNLWRKKPAHGNWLVLDCDWFLLMSSFSACGITEHPLMFSLL
uniref:Uncharacterized protein n=1 Tax=Triticum urartu TaxID=4572 RepID=A0A8R7K1B8_TRIUA